MKKLLTILLALLLLCGCGKSVDDKVVDKTDEEKTVETLPTDGSNENAEYYLNLLKEFKAKDKDKTKTDDNQEFDAFLDTVFNDTVSESYLFMHTEVKDYKAMGLTKPEVTWGKVSYELDTDEIASLVKQYNTLVSFDYDSLSYAQEYDYDVLRYSLLEALTGQYFYQYSLPFSDTSSTSEGIITNLMEFKFYDEESVDDYVTLLKEVPDFINQVIEYSKKQSENGLYHTDTMLDSEVTYIKSVIDNDGQSLIEAFEGNSEYQDRHDEIASIIKYDVADAFNTLYEYVQTLYGKGDDASLQLCNIDKNYAEYMFIVNTSTNGNIEDNFTTLFNYYADVVNDFFDAYNENNNLYTDYQTWIGNMESEPLNLDGKGMLEYLRNNTSERYKKIDVDYQVSELTTLGSSTAGYYMNAPIDDPNQNVIRLNANMSSSMSGIAAYEILAHEGFPGHLYQHYCFQETNPHKFRSTQSFIGYTEGYADLASNDALELLNYPDAEMVKCAKLESVTLNTHVIYSIVDIAVNYMGYDIDAVKDLMKEMNLSESNAEPVYKAVISMPTVFCRYGVGFIKQYTIRENAKKELGDKFDYVTYSDTILKNGPLPFTLLEGAVQEYIDENK